MDGDAKRFEELPHSSVDDQELHHRRRAEVVDEEPARRARPPMWAECPSVRPPAAETSAVNGP